MKERAPITYDMVQNDERLWLAYNMGRNDAHVERMRDEYRLPEYGKGGFKVRTLYWHTDPSYPCPTCGHVATTTDGDKEAASP